MLLVCRDCLDTFQETIWILLYLALTIADEGLLKLDSFDRIIPCQDELPRGNSSIGNLVALPMQPEAKARGGSSFIRRDARLSFMRQARMHLRTSRRHRA